MRARAAAAVAIVVVAVLGVATAREVEIGKDAVAAADGAALRSDWGPAIASARAAAEAFVPGSPWPARGWARLEAIGHDAEARGDDATGLKAYGAMRAAALATRAPGVGAEAWRARAEEGLARVAAAEKTAAGPRATSEAMLDALREHEPPPTGSLALLAAAGLAMIGGLARLAWVDAPAEARVAQGLAAVGLVAYAIACFVTV
jgi:hypothetical protein